MLRLHSYIHLLKIHIHDLLFTKTKMIWIIIILCIVIVTLLILSIVLSAENKCSGLKQPRNTIVKYQLQARVGPSLYSGSSISGRIYAAKSSSGFQNLNVIPVSKGGSSPTVTTTSGIVTGQTVNIDNSAISCCSSNWFYDGTTQKPMIWVNSSTSENLQTVVRSSTIDGASSLAVLVSTQTVANSAIPIMTCTCGGFMIFCQGNGEKKLSVTYLGTKSANAFGNVQVYDGTNDENSLPLTTYGLSSFNGNVGIFGSIVGTTTKTNYLEFTAFPSKVTSVTADSSTPVNYTFTLANGTGDGYTTGGFLIFGRYETSGDSDLGTSVITITGKTSTTVTGTKTSGGTPTGGDTAGVPASGTGDFAGIGASAIFIPAKDALSTNQIGDDNSYTNNFSSTITTARNFGMGDTYCYFPAFDQSDFEVKLYRWARSNPSGTYGFINNAVLTAGRTQKLNTFCFSNGSSDDVVIIRDRGNFHKYESNPADSAHTFIDDWVSGGTYNSSDSFGFVPANSSTAAGDPEVTPLVGPYYMMPHTELCYRAFHVFTKSFWLVINARFVLEDKYSYHKDIFLQYHNNGKTQTAQFEMFRDKHPRIVRNDGKILKFKNNEVSDLNVKGISFGTGHARSLSISVDSIDLKTMGGYLTIQKKHMWLVPSLTSVQQNFPEWK